MGAGRPTEYNLEFAKEICEAFENSHWGLNQLCDLNPHWPSAQTIRSWIRTHDQFLSMYREAKERQAHYTAEEMMRVAYDDSKDWKVIEDAEGNEKTVLVAESVNRARLKVDTLKWQAARLLPRIYGDVKPESKSDELTLMQKLIDKL